MASAQLIAARIAPRYSLSEVGAYRRAREFAVRERDAVLSGGHDHALEEFRADLMAEAARAAVDHHHDVALHQAEDARGPLVEDGRDFLDLEIVVSAAECAHLFPLASLGLLRNAVRYRVKHLTAFLDALEIRRDSPTLLDGPLRTANEHCVHLVRVEADRAGAANAGRNPLVKRVRERLLDRHDIGALQARVQATHAAGNVEADAAGRRHAALGGIERGHAPDRKTVAPVRIRHDI